MTIALLLTHPGKGASSTSSDSQTRRVTNDANHISDQSSNVSKKSKCISVFNKPLNFKPHSLIGGGNLIIYPMVLLGQCKVEIETHVQPGSLTIYVYYGQSRPRNAKFLSQNDVLTTYGVLASKFSAENSEDNGGLYSVQWFRIVLDEEAHTIKLYKSQISIAIVVLAADRRWCLTGTPIQGTVEERMEVVKARKQRMISGALTDQEVRTARIDEL